jgi:hypothetical protein
VLHGPWWRQPLPAWAQAVAACLIFGAGLWMGVERGRVTRLASPAVAAPTAVAAAPAAGAPAAAEAGAPLASAADLEALERRLRDEIALARTGAGSAAAPAGSQAELLAQVRTLIDESEQRQQRALALRTAQLLTEVESQRRMDLTQIQRVVGQMEGLTGAEVRDQRQMLNYLMRVSQQQGR